MRLNCLKRFCSTVFFLVKFRVDLITNKDPGMKKNLYGTILFFLSISASACPIAVPTSDSNFCSSFKSAATCYCTSSGLPSGMCQDMNALYNRMMIVFGSLQKACEYQHYTTPQDCIDNWTCYLRGGVDSRGSACSSTQMPCH